MPNPRYLTDNGEPSVELLRKLDLAKRVYFGNLEWFCDKYACDLEALSDIERVYLIGSHATESEWDDGTSDLDFKLVNPSALPMQLHDYKRLVLDKLLHEGEKPRWIDLFFAREDYQVTTPRWDLTDYWDSLRD